MARKKRGCTIRATTDATRPNQFRAATNVFWVVGKAGIRAGHGDARSRLALAVSSTVQFTSLLSSGVYEPPDSEAPPPPPADGAERRNRTYRSYRTSSRSRPGPPGCRRAVCWCSGYASRITNHQSRTTLIWHQAHADAVVEELQLVGAPCLPAHASRGSSSRTNAWSTTAATAIAASTAAARRPHRRPTLTPRANNPTDRRPMTASLAMMSPISAPAGMRSSVTIPGSHGARHGGGSHGD